MKSYVFREKTIEKLRFARKSKTLAEIGQTKQAWTETQGPGQTPNRAHRTDREADNHRSDGAST